MTVRDRNLSNGGWRREINEIWKRLPSRSSPDEPNYLIPQVLLRPLNRVVRQLHFSFAMRTMKSTISARPHGRPTFCFRLLCSHFLATYFRCQRNIWERPPPAPFYQELPLSSRACRVGGELPSYRSRFVFSVCRLVSRRCHDISTILGCHPAPHRTVLALFMHTAPHIVLRSQSDLVDLRLGLVPREHTYADPGPWQWGIADPSG